jgi:hypothetical protein
MIAAGQAKDASMNRPFRLAAFAVSLLAVAAPPAAAERYLTGNWAGGPVFQGNNFRYCTLTLNFQDRRRMEIQLTAPLVMTIYVEKPDWNWNPVTDGRVTVEIDQRFRKVYRTEVKADKRNTLILHVGNDQALRAALASGEQMHWTVSEKDKYPFSLLNGNNAMRKLLACVALYGVE